MYRILQQEKTHKQLSKHHHTEPVAFLSTKRLHQEKDVTTASDFHSQKGYPRNTKYQHNGNRRILFCDHCKANGHTINKCFKLHGYPSQNKGRKVTAFACTDEDNGPPPGLNEDEFSRLLSLMETVKQRDTQDSTLHYAELASSSTFAGISCINGGNMTQWIIDSGASDHICNCLTDFLDYADVSLSNHFITIPNGAKIKVEKMGTIKLLDQLYLKNVFYVPSFKFNLISVQKMCYDHNASIQFTNDMCFLQGLR